MKKKSQHPVESFRYDEEWIKSAWGNDNFEQLLSPGPLVPRPRVRRAIELSAISPSTRLLDIACGRGEVPIIAAEIGAYAVGIDYSASVLKYANHARRVRTDMGYIKGKLEFIQSDACHLPFPDGSFDRITMLDIIEHLTPNQLKNMFNEVHRLISPNGYAVIHTLPNRWVYTIGYRLLKAFMRNLPENPRSEIEQQIHINEQDLVGLSNLITECGLSHKLWLEQHIPSQARWQKASTQFSDNRRLIYPKFAGLRGRILELACLTPLKLVLSNDIYGIVWKNNRPNNIFTPLALTENTLIRLFGNKRIKENDR